MAKIKFLAFFVLLVLAGCSIEKEPPVETINPSILQEKVDNKESFILVVGNELRCDSCGKYMKGGLRKLEDRDQYTAYYLTIDTVKEQKEMDKLIKVLRENLKQDMTKSVPVPTTYFVVNGESVESVPGPMVYEELTKKKTEYEIKN